MPRSTTMSPRQSRVETWLCILAFGILWADLVRQLSFRWSADEQYSYGWCVPVLVVGLLWGRWAGRPAVSPPCIPKFSGPPGSHAGRIPWSILLGALVVLLAAALLPLRVIHEVNPDWPLISWSLAGAVVGISLFAVYLLGGWRWVKHFAFPICFMLVAVKWPGRIEHPLTQGLMRSVAGVTVEVLYWLDIPALQRGNLIDLRIGTLGVQEACSGIRSFQSTLMVALFLGELYLLHWPRRVLLVALGLTIALFLNLVRTFILAWQAASSGIAAVDRWHDPAGLTILAVSLVCLWTIAKWLRPKPGALAASAPPGQAFVLPKAFVYAISAWIVLMFFATELWFRVHEARRAAGVQWSVAFPTQLSGFREIILSDRENKLLKQDLSQSASWQENDGKEWVVYYLRWLPGTMLSRLGARGHRPEICMRASGFELKADSGSVLLAAGDLQLPFQKYEFEGQGKPVHVFFCLWEDGMENLPRTGELTKRDRLAAAFSAQRLLGQRSMELILRGYRNLEEAQQAVRVRLPQLIEIEGRKPKPASRQSSITNHP